MSREEKLKVSIVRRLAFHPANELIPHVLECRDGIFAKNALEILPWFEPESGDECG